MELSQTGLALLFAAALACGFFMGALYDAFAILPTLCGKVYSPRLHRRLSGIKRPPVGGQKLRKFRRAALPAALFLHDLLMALTAGVLTVLVIYRFNDGQFRASVPIGFFAGMLIYRSTLRRLMSPVTELCGFAVGYALQCVAFCFVAPSRALVGRIKKLAATVIGRVTERNAHKNSEKEKGRILAAAKICGCLDPSPRKERREKVNGQKKNEQSAHRPDRGSASALPDRFGDQYNAV